jgi:hypothetical protein
MFYLDAQIQKQFSSGWSRLINRLIYLPGAAILIYGLWLSVTV